MSERSCSAWSSVPATRSTAKAPARIRRPRTRPVAGEASALPDVGGRSQVAGQGMGRSDTVPLCAVGRHGCQGSGASPRCKVRVCGSGPYASHTSMCRGPGRPGRSGCREAIFTCPARPFCRVGRSRQARDAVVAGPLRPVSISRWSSLSSSSSATAAGALRRGEDNGQEAGCGESEGIVLHDC